MNEVVKKLELFMSEIHLRQRGFMHNTCGSFTKKKKE